MAREVTVSNADDGRTVEIDQGDTIVVDLEENISTGYSWMLEDLPESVMQVVDDSRIAASGARLGAPGRRRITIAASGPGEATIKASLRRPWERGRPAQTYTIRVVVR
jgi:inhibitor of cysteine peptidase